MSALATQNGLVTVTLGWREPNGQVIEFGGGAGSSAGPATSSSLSHQSSDEHPAGDSNVVDLFA